MAGTGDVREARVAEAQRLNDDVIDRALIRRWLAWGFFWLLFFPTLAVVLSTKFTYRRESLLYVSLWYLIAAFIWTDVNLVLLILGQYNIPGINNAAWHGLFIHYVVGLWITPAGYVLIYYFLPASVRNPIYSHKL